MIRRRYFFYAMLVLTNFITYSCSVQKRKYQKGYFVEWKSQSLHKNKEHKLADNKDNKTKADEKNLEESRLNQTQLALSASADIFFTTSNKTKQTNVLRLPDDSCDVLVYKDGTESAVRLLEISATQIKYKKCSIPDGPLYTSNKSELFMIKYANGIKEVIKTATPVSTKETAPRANDGSQPRSPTWLATNALIFSLIGLYPILFPASITGLIMAIIQIKRIETEPDKYAGLKKSRIALVLSIIGLYLSVLLFYLISRGTF